MSDDEFDPLLDCYLSWEAFIAEMRRRWLAGEPLGEGPWSQRDWEDRSWPDRST